jgi:histidinol dehydrogenase
MARRHLKSRADTASKSTAPQVDVSTIVKGVIDDIRANGDAAVRKYSEVFDKWSPASFKLSREDIEASIAACSAQTIEDIKQVQRNVRAFAQAQRDSIKDFEYEIQPGVTLGQKNLPIQTVGA